MARWDLAPEIWRYGFFFRGFWFAFGFSFRSFFGLPLWIVFGIILRIFLGFALEDDFGLRAKTLVICQLDDLAHVVIVTAEVQDVIGANVGGEPVLTIDLFAIGHELGREILRLVLLFLGSDCVWHGFA